jgi:hypothetical protein
MKKLVILAVVLLGFAATSFAQVSATATATANIQTSLSISKSVDLNFGNIYSPVNGGGTVTLAASSAVTRAASANVVLGTGNGSAAKFQITGLPNTNPHVSWSLNPITLTSGVNTMSVTLSSSTGGTIALDASGNATLYIGGVLTLAQNQAVGYYTNNSDLTITTNY